MQSPQRKPRIGQGHEKSGSGSASAWPLRGSRARWSVLPGPASGTGAGSGDGRHDSGQPSGDPSSCAVAI